MAKRETSRNRGPKSWKSKNRGPGFWSPMPTKTVGSSPPSIAVQESTWAPHACTRSTPGPSSHAFSLSTAATSCRSTRAHEIQSGQGQSSSFTGRSEGPSPLKQPCQSTSSRVFISSHVPRVPPSSRLRQGSEKAVHIRRTLRESTKHKAFHRAQREQPLSHWPCLRANGAAVVTVNFASFGSILTRNCTSPLEDSRASGGDRSRIGWWFQRAKF